LYGHIQKLAEAEAAGLKKVGIEADIYQYISFSACQPTYSSQR
jgi:multimeric flavodoxin WrbA